jgi:hypothetical protein
VQQGLRCSGTAAPFRHGGPHTPCAVEAAITARHTLAPLPSGAAAPFRRVTVRTDDAITFRPCGPRPTGRTKSLRDYKETTFLSTLRQMNDPTSQRHRHRLGAIAHVELRENVLHVRLHRLLRDTNRRADLLVRLA